MSDQSTVGHEGQVDRERPDERIVLRPSPALRRTADTAVVGIVLAGGQGTRLAPLTRDRAKPAVPFGVRHRLIDFALSNLVNSGVRSIYVLLEHQSRSVREHLRAAWHAVPGDGMIHPVQSTGRPFLGTADAVRASLDRVQAHSADLVLVFGADHVYRMDVRQMMRFHRESGADATVAALPVPREAARAFGVIDCDVHGRIANFHEKPDDPPPMPGDPAMSLASMGNYCFDADALLRALRDCADIEALDFGRHVLPRMLRQGRRLHAYDFAANRISRLRRDGNLPYWRDVGTIDAYFDATLDTLGPRPAFDLDCAEWPIRAPRRTWPDARVLRAELHNARIGHGALVRDARVANSVVRRAACIAEGAELDRCIVLDGAIVGKGARLRRVIVDRHAVVPPGAAIGFDRERDVRHWSVTESGVTVVGAPRDAGR